MIVGPLVLVGIVAVLLVRHSEIVRAASLRFRQTWRIHFRSAHIGGAGVLIAYGTVVALNSVWFGYNFWTEPAPTSTADGAAVASLGILGLVAAVVGAGLYALMCFVAVDSDSQIGEGLRWSVRWMPLSLPAFVAAAIALPLGLPSVLIVVVLAASPLYLRSGAEERRPGGYRRFVRINLHDLLAVGVALALVAIPVDLAVAAALSLNDSVDGIAELGVVALVYCTWLLVIAAAGWTASAVGTLWARMTPAAEAL